MIPSSRPRTVASAGFRRYAGTQDERLTMLLGSLRSNLFRMWTDT